MRIRPIYSWVSAQGDFPPTSQPARTALSVFASLLCVRSFQLVTVPKGMKLRIDSCTNSLAASMISFRCLFLGTLGVEISRLSIRNKEIALGNVEGGKKRPTRNEGRNFGLPHSRDRVLATYKQIEIRRTSRGRMGRPIEKAETRTVEAIDRSIERGRR